MSTVGPQSELLKRGKFVNNSHAIIILHEESNLQMLHSVLLE